jgi:hypothetical protein
MKKTLIHTLIFYLGILTIAYSQPCASSYTLEVNGTTINNKTQYPIIACSSINFGAHFNQQECWIQSGTVQTQVFYNGTLLNCPTCTNGQYTASTFVDEYENGQALDMSVSVVIGGQSTGFGSGAYYLVCSFYYISPFDGNTYYSSIATSPVQIETSPPASFTSVGGTGICPGIPLLLETTATIPGLAYQYQWYLNGNPITGATNSSYSASNSGSYTVATTCNAWSTSSTSAPWAPEYVYPASITPNGPTTFCINSGFVLSDNNNKNLSSAMTYTWYDPKGDILENYSYYSVNFNSAFQLSGTYTVEEVYYSCTSPYTSTASIPVQVNSLPTPIISSSFCPGNLVINANTGTGLTYQWYLNNSPITGATSSSFVPLTSGLYSVSELNSNNCSATTPQVYITPSTITPPVNYYTCGNYSTTSDILASGTIYAGGVSSTCASGSTVLLNGSNTTMIAGSIILSPGFVASTGSILSASISVPCPNNNLRLAANLDTLTQSDLLVVYPNPSTNGLFTIKSPNDVTISINNLLGQEVYQSSSAVSTQEVDLSNQSNGIYLVQTTGGGKTTTQKVIVSK